MKNAALLNFLLTLQRECGGSIPFQRYMKEALYHREYGYYSTQIQDVGTAGDFSTSATLDSGLGMAIAAWITKRSSELNRHRIPVIEIGAGSGTLAQSVLSNLDWKTRWHTSYMILETSPLLRKHQEKLLRRKGVQWISSLAETLNHLEGKALIFSNELVDAFPCRIFQKNRGEWEELGVKISNEGSLSECVISATPADAWFDQFGHLPEGQRVERLDSFRDWLLEWACVWREGRLLTIDYGERAESLYQNRKAGSLRSYWRHQRLTGKDLYARFGKQDLTTDVNFSDLIRWGKELGWKNDPLTTQREFVKSWLPEKNHHRQPDRFSTPGDAGDAFKVLEQTPRD